MLRKNGFNVVGSCGLDEYKRKGGKVEYPGGNR